MSFSNEELETIRTYDNVADEWSDQHHTSGFWANELARFHELLPSGRVIDIGAGGGRDAPGLAELGYEYTGTDVSDKLIRVAKRNNPNQVFLKQNIYELKFDEKFDGFWCAAVLLHIPKTKIDLALQGIKRVLKPEAVGFISIKEGGGQKMEKETWNDGSQHKRLFVYWSRDEFSGVLERNEFKQVDYFYRPDSVKTRWHCFFVKAAKD